MLFNVNTDSGAFFMIQHVNTLYLQVDLFKLHVL